MNIFELVVFWVSAVCGLGVFKAVEAKAGFWGGSLFFMAGAGAAFWAIQFLAGRFSRKPRKDGENNNGTSEKEHQ